MPRIPLPVKLLLSYLGVLLLGAGPTFFYIRVVLQGDLLRESSLRMSSQIQKVAESLRSVPDDERLQVLRKFGEIRNTGRDRIEDSSNFGGSIRLRIEGLILRWSP